MLSGIKYLLRKFEDCCFKTRGLRGNVHRNKHNEIFGQQ